MLSVYQQLRSVFYSTGGEESTTKKPSRAPQSNQEQPRPRRGKTKLNNKESEDDIESDDVSQRQTRHFTGVVSQVNDCCGMVDKKVFFDMSVVVGGRRPAIGSSAHVIAERPHPHAGWTASRVEITSPWKPEERSTKRVLIGYISQLSRTKGVVTCSDEEICFSTDSLNSSASGHYWPHTNDYVQITLLSQDGETVVSDLCPLREKQITGHVTSVSHGYGAIDEEGVYFTSSACTPRGFSPRQGERVRAWCVECRHKRSNWRAFVVEPASLEPITNTRSPTVPTLPTLTPLTVQRSQAEECVAVSENLDFGEVLIGEEKTLTFTITNQGGRGTSLLSCGAVMEEPQVTFSPNKPWCHCSGPLDGQTSMLTTPPVAEQSCNGDEGREEEQSCNGDGREEGQSCNGKGRERGSSNVSYSEDNHTPRHIHITADGGACSVELTLKASILGLVNVVLVMCFPGGLRIARYARGSVVDPRVLSLGPTASFIHRRGNQGRQEKGLYHATLSLCRVPGERPMKLRPLLRLPTHLKSYNVPQDLRACVEGGEGGDGVDLEALEFIRPCLGEPLCMESYSARFQALLHLEELQREEDMAEFTLHSASPRRRGALLSLSVPGLAEGRPSLLVGDRAIFSSSPGVRGQSAGVKGQVQEEPSWEGYIHEVRGGEILLRFAEVFHDNFNNEDYDVMFTFNRTPLRRMHHAVEMAETIGSKTLFPGNPIPKPPRFKLRNRSVPIPNQPPPPHLHGKINPLPTGKFFNPSLNGRQRAAVSRIARGQGRPAPYVLFGPPGTGKTVTVVEAILQVFSLSSATRVLAAAPSNSATDLLAERLHESGLLAPGQLVRLNALQRSVEPAPSIQPYCVTTDTVATAARCRIVVATCVTAGLLHALGLAAGHFTHVFVDEAGQATEPECLLPVSLLAGSPEGQVVLAGDPQQLGPILSSPLASTSLTGGGGGEEGGLGLSLLERLMSRAPYCRDEGRFQDHGCYDPLMVTKLVANYRSHPAILQLYSDTFYHSELTAMADHTLRECLEQWNELPTKGFPLLFHGVVGEDMREGSSPSWFNPVEAVQVVKHVQALLDNGSFAPKPSEVGVITPYRKQGEKIRLLLKSVGVEGVKVGSVEEFQGQERLAIVLSTVRSTREFLGFDARHHLGFLSNQKRFNVAISRAQALLVVVGNPHLLCQDEHWCKLVDYAVSNGSYRGCPLPRPPTEEGEEEEEEEEGGEGGEGGEV